MRSAASPAVVRDVAGMHAAIERFLKACHRPHLLEPGEELFALQEGSFSIDLADSRLTLQAWSDTRNLTRRIVNIGEERRGRLELVVERFARKPGTDVPTRPGRGPIRRKPAVAVAAWSFESDFAVSSRDSSHPGSLLRSARSRTSSTAYLPATLEHFCGRGNPASPQLQQLLMAWTRLRASASG